MSRTIKKHPKGEKPRKLKQTDDKRVNLKLSSFYELEEDDFEK
jgi:hypothetical protein